MIRLKGNRKPRLSTFGKLADALNVPVEEIVDFSRYNWEDLRTLVPQNNKELMN